MKRFIAVLAVVFTTIASSAMALDLQTARVQGLVGEKQDGYLAVVKSTTEANALVSDINNRRKAEFVRISKENGQSLDVVGKIAAVEIIKNLPSGAKYQDARGEWNSK